MKKVIISIVLLLALIAGGALFLFSNANDLIKAQIEQQGTKFLGTQVSVSAVDLSLTEARLTINQLDVANPEGFSVQNAFALNEITLDLGEISQEPYTVQALVLKKPDVLYEFDANGKGNLIVLKDNLQAALPKSKSEPEPTEAGANPLVIVENVIVKDVTLRLDFTNLPMGDYELEKKNYEVVLPEFNAGSVGKPNGIPADQVGAAVAKAMLDNVIARAKVEAKKRLEEEAKKRVKEEVDKKKDELKDKAREKLKDLF